MQRTIKAMNKNKKGKHPASFDPETEIHDGPVTEEILTE